MPPRLRKGKTKRMVDGSRDAALLAVEVYNKPRTTFRTQGFVTLMIIAWTRLFHAHFHHTIGDRFHYKKKNGRYDLIDGERRSWDLEACIRNHGRLSNPVESNLRFFIKLRNKIEHRQITRVELDSILFGECQALLANYEKQLVEWFGTDYVLNEALAFSLQFSTLRTPEQRAANKDVLSRDVQDIQRFISMYRDSLPNDVFGSQEYSVKLIVLPKVTNTNRGDLAVEFIRYDELSHEEKAEYERLVTLVKDKRVVQEAVNVGRLKSAEVTRKVDAARRGTFNQYDHTCFWNVFRVRPATKEIEAGDADPFDTNAAYCHYDEPHDDYVYTQEWVDFIVGVLDGGLITTQEVRARYVARDVLQPADFGG